jgi:hypothetical protein
MTVMPRDIRLVQPFTDWADLDDKPGIDGVNVFVQPINANGDPIQAAGSMYIELFTFRPASGHNKEDRIAVWDFSLRTDQDQASHWRRAIQMYELPVVFPADAATFKPESTFVLTITYQPPIGGRLSDEMLLHTQIHPPKSDRR